MVKEKKNTSNHNGNNVNQGGDFKFVDDFNTWRKNCQSVSGSDLSVEHIENLYVFLKNHMKGNIRARSRNDGLDGRGAIQFLSVIETFIDNDLLTVGNAKIIEDMADQLDAMKGTGKVPKSEGGTGAAYDPAFIVFTEVDKTDAGDNMAPRTVQGHYKTKWYAKKNNTNSVPDSWLAGENPPHLALFSEEDTEYSKPKGLLAIMREASELIENAPLEVEVTQLPSGVDEVDLDEIKSVESFFNDVIKNTAYWSAGGKLLVNKLRKELQATDFEVKPNEQNPVREITNIGRIENKEAIAGTVVSFKLTSTATPLINLVDRALKRANKTTSPVKHPDGGYYKAWQNARRGGFDYRRTAREKFGEDTGRYSPDAKIIGKMWQQILWKR
tara:strand:+ start:6302 stop:7456 length:1155 start_codon:yes stop_codon:yes gene_type:complete